MLKIRKRRRRHNVDLNDERPYHTNEWYRKKIKAVRRKNPKADLEASDFISKRGLAPMLNKEDLNSMPYDARNKELRRQYDLLSGNYEKSEARRTKDNLMEMLGKIGLTQEQLQFAKDNITTQWIRTHPEEFDWWFGSIFKEAYWNEGGKRIMVQDEMTKSDIRDDFWAGMMNMFERKAHGLNPNAKEGTKVSAKRQTLLDKWKYCEEQKTGNSTVYLGDQHPEQDSQKISNDDLQKLR